MLPARLFWSKSIKPILRLVNFDIVLSSGLMFVETLRLDGLILGRL